MSPRGAPLALACLLGMPAVAWATQQCEIQGQPVNPAAPASTAGKSGTLRCKDTDSGTLLRESTYVDGHEVGLVRSFHPDGKLRRVAFLEEAGGERAVAEFTARGQLSQLRCADQPLLAPAVDDARLCGFGKTMSKVELFDDNGVVRSRMAYVAGKRVRAESLYDNGKPATQEELLGSQRIDRRFSSEGVKRSEVISVMQERGGLVRQRALDYSEKGTLVRDQRWDAAGEPVRDDSYFANGHPRSKVGYSGSGDARVADVTEFHENGQRQAQGRFLAPARAPLLPVGTHRRFNDKGQLVAESNYDAKGRAVRERTWGDDGVLQRDDAIPADGLRKPPSQ